MISTLNLVKITFMIRTDKKMLPFACIDHWPDSLFCFHLCVGLPYKNNQYNLIHAGKLDSKFTNKIVNVGCLQKLTEKC